MNDECELFRVGEVYECRAYSNYDFVYRYRVVKRTAYYVTFTDLRHIERRRVRVWKADGTEWASFGRGVSSPTICAARPKVYVHGEAGA